MPTNKISKVQLNDILYLLKGDADNIREVMASIVNDLYSRIDTGSDNTTILNIIERLSNVEEGKASLEQIEELWELIDNLSGKIPNSTINYFFAYKISSEAPNRPANTEEYPPQGWKSYPESPSSDEVVYMTTARKVNNSWQNWADGYRWTLPIAYSEKSQLTLSIESNIALYKLSSGTPSLSELKRKTPSYPEGWSTTPDFVVQNNQEVYMITAKTINGKYLLINGYYWSSPMRIGGGSTSSTGTDTTVYNYVYFPSSYATAPDAPSFTVRQIEDAQEINGWHDRPQGISEGQKYEYVSLSVGEGLDRNNWSQPVLWSKWGERGMDGDGVEYVYTRRSNYSPAPSLIFNVFDEGYLQDDYLPKDENNEFWKDLPLGVTYEYPYEFVATRKLRNGVWQLFTGPALWAKFGKDGSGNQGLSGAVIRYIGDWSSVVENAREHKFTFEYNTPEGANVRYIDVVTMPATSGGLDYYQCKEAYTTDASSLSPDLDSEHWESAQHFKFLVTDTLISNVIAAGSISANDVIIKEGEGLSTSIVAGMTSSAAKYSTLGDVRIWAGTEGDLPNIQNAPFLVTLEGKMVSTNAYVNGLGIFDGEVTARSLNINTPDGKTAMQFRILDTNITVNDKTYLAGTPVIMAFKDDLTYILDMTNITYNPDDVTYTSFPTRTPKYPLNYSNIGEFIQALIACNEVTGGYSSVPDTARLNYVAEENTLYLVQSAKLATKVTIRIDGNLVPFTGWTVNYGIISNFAVISGQLRIVHKYVYKIEVYNDGTVIQTDTTSGLVGTVILDIEGNIVESDLVDQPVNDIFTANAPVFAVMPKPNYNFASIKEYQTNFSLYPGNPGPID